MTKIKFKKDNKTLSTLIDKYLDKGEYYKALSLLRQQNGIQSKLVIADVLSEMEFYAQANQSLYEVLSNDQDNEDAKLQLAQDCFVRGDMTTAFYYASEEAFDMLGEAFSSLDFDDNPDLSKYRIVYPRDDTFLKDGKALANDEFTKGNFDKAYQIYTDLLEIAPKDIDIINDLCFVCIMKNKESLAQKYAEMALEIDPLSLNALSNAILVYDMIEDEAKRDFYAEELDKVTTNDLLKVFKVAASFCECNDHVRANKWLKRYIDGRTNYEVMILYAISCYNCRMYAQAKETLLNLLAVEPNNPTVKYYLDYVLEHQDQQHVTLEYTPQLPSKEIETRITHLQTLNDFYGMWDNEILRDEIDWALASVNGNEFMIELIGKINDTDSDKVEPYLANLLLSPKFSKKVKKFVLHCLLFRGMRGNIDIVIDGRFYKLHLPKKMPNTLLNPLLVVYENLGVERVLSRQECTRINAVATDLQKRLLENPQIIPEAVLSSMIARRAHLEGIGDGEITKIFDITYDELKKYTEVVYN